MTKTFKFFSVYFPLGIILFLVSATTRNETAVACLIVWGFFLWPLVVVAIICRIISWDHDSPRAQANRARMNP